MKKLTNYERADDRAKQFFDRVYVGTHAKDADQYGYKWSWNSSASETRHTLSHVSRGSRYCAYCGMPSLSIQAGLRKQSGYLNRPESDYKITGHTCVCKQAMDQQELEIEREALLKAHRKQLIDLDSRMPKADPKIAASLIRAAAEYQIKRVEEGWSADFSGLGMTLGVRNDHSH